MGSAVASNDRRCSSKAFTKIQRARLEGAIALNICGIKCWDVNVNLMLIEGVHHSMLGQSDEVCLNMFNLSVVVDLTHGF